MKHRFILLPSMILMMIFSVTVHSQESERLKIGDTIPGFFLRDLKGDNFFLKDHVGKGADSKNKGILFSFCASWCKPCRKEIPELEILYKKYYEKGILFYLIDVGENKKKAREFIEEIGTPIPVLLDRYQKVLEKMGRPGLPYTILIDNTGKVKFINTGFAEKKADEIIKNLERELDVLIGADSGASSE